MLALSIHDNQREAALQALSDLDGGHATYDPHRDRVVVPASRGVDTLREALHRLDAAGIRPGDIALHKPTLDDVFLHLTGHLTEHVTGAVS